MRHDDQSSSPNLSATTEPRFGSRVRAWAWPVVVIVLMVLTSLALAITVSVWLVPPYFILMVWILAPAQGPRDPAPALPEPGSQQVSDVESLLEPSESEIGLRSQAEPVVAAASPSEIAAEPDGGNDPNPVAVKTKRGKGRGRKAKGGPVVEPAAASATWIQVGPGKFVRVEGPSTNTEMQPEPALALSESESTPPLASASQSASEDVEELVPQEFAVDEVRSEFENRPAIFDAPATHDEFVDAEPINDNADLSSSDAEALLCPSPEEESVLPPEELGPQEFAVEISPELEDCVANLDEPEAYDDECSQDEPISDAALSSSPDAEALLCPSSSEEVAWSEPVGSFEEVLEVPVPRELAAEIRPELEGCSATFDEPAACDELIQDESITVTDVALSAPDLEACPQPSPEEVVLSEPDRSPDFELHQDETYVDEGACQEAPASHENDEVVAEVEDGFDDFVEVTGASVPASSELLDHELGPVEPSGDQGIALDALDVAWTTELADPPFDEARSVQSAFLRAVTAPPRSTDNAPFVSWRGVWPRVGPAVGRSSSARPSRRVVRSGPNARVSPGFRRRSRRGVGSYRMVCRTFPPRSPPVRGTLPRFETGRGVRESD
ncbi:hypothetical protein SAMN05444166_5258 [Singulisphaera sp. GP187]|uniref:hypothetical protein n=1 Tax=Singulisphaera sp. GP187 TaxID=1882752 RepID=UPI0009260DAC|nr:hypothetical protein [Singulisphaera sp. GP187]SIO56573.1 hypothetical protein SAMN05444166_5258 [Singulisphaera sp. GP187]